MSINLKPQNETLSGKSKQKDWIKTQLRTHGYITRNQCLKNYISRLAMHIDQLKKMGWEFETKRIKVTTPMGWTGSDFRYTLVNDPESMYEKKEKLVNIEIKNKFGGAL